MIGKTSLSQNFMRQGNSWQGNCTSCGQVIGKSNAYYHMTGSGPMCGECLLKNNKFGSSEWELRLIANDSNSYHTKTSPRRQVNEYTQKSESPSDRDGPVFNGQNGRAKEAHGLSYSNLQRQFLQSNGPASKKRQYDNGPVMRENDAPFGRGKHVNRMRDRSVDQHAFNANMRSNQKESVEPPYNRMSSRSRSMDAFRMDRDYKTQRPRGVSENRTRQPIPKSILKTSDFRANQNKEPVRDAAFYAQRLMAQERRAYGSRDNSSSPMNRGASGMYERGRSMQRSRSASRGFIEKDAYKPSRNMGPREKSSDNFNSRPRGRSVGRSMSVSRDSDGGRYSRNNGTESWRQARYPRDNGADNWRQDRYSQRESGRDFDRRSGNLQKSNNRQRSQSRSRDTLYSNSANEGRFMRKGDASYGNGGYRRNNNKENHSKFSRDVDFNSMVNGKGSWRSSERKAVQDNSDYKYSPSNRSRARSLSRPRSNFNSYMSGNLNPNTYDIDPEYDPAPIYPTSNGGNRRYTSRHQLY